MTRAVALHARHLLLALRAGDAYRVSRALAVEAAYYAMAGGRQRRRRDQVLHTAQALADRLQHPHALGLTRLVSGMAAFNEGHWSAARQRLEQAEVTLREQCTGVVWERATARLMTCVALFFLGEVRELCQRLPRLLEAAEARGDRYEATDLRMRINHIGCLAADAPAQAREQVAQAMGRGLSEAYSLQHWWSLMAQVEIALYEGQGPMAWHLLAAQWPALRRSGLLRAQYLLLESLHHRACAALAVAAAPGCAGATRRRLLRIARRAARRMEREQMPWGDALARLVRAGVAATVGRAAEAEALLTAAEAGFVAADMALYAAAARHRRGGLLRGARGQDMIAAAETWMAAQHIRHPSRMVDMLAPGAWPP